MHILISTQSSARVSFWIITDLTYSPEVKQKKILGWLVKKKGKFLKTTMRNSTSVYAFTKDSSNTFWFCMYQKKLQKYHQIYKINQASKHHKQQPAGFSRILTNKTLHLFSTPSLLALFTYCSWMNESEIEDSGRQGSQDMPSHVTGE